MRSFFLVTLALALGTVGASASAEEAVGVPSYRPFITECVKNVVSPGDEKIRVFLSALMCHCVYEDLSKRPTMTAPQFESATMACSRQAQANPKGFVDTYTKRFEQRMNTDDTGEAPSRLVR